jgi:hypothetical protein
MRLPIVSAIAFAAILASAGCSEQKTVTAKNESVAGVAAKVADAGLHFQPGRWETKMTFGKLDMPDMPPEVAKMMEKSMAEERTYTSCLTKADVEKPAGKFFGQDNDKCKYDSFVMSGGRIDAKMSCKSPEGTQEMTMNGVYTPETYVMTMAIKGEHGGGKAMNMTMGMTAKRIGECTGKEDAGA